MKDKMRLDPCPECGYTEPTRANCQACFGKKYENGEITDDDIKEFFDAFGDELSKELGVEFRFQSSTSTARKQE